MILLLGTFIGNPVKLKETSMPDVVSEDDAEDNRSKKRHLNVVFIGHIESVYYYNF